MTATASAPEGAPQLPEGWINALIVHAATGTLENDVFVPLDSTTGYFDAADVDQARASFDHQAARLKDRVAVQARPARVTLIAAPLPAMILTCDDLDAPMLDAALDAAISEGQVVDMWATHLPA